MKSSYLVTVKHSRSIKTAGIHWERVPNRIVEASVKHRDPCSNAGSDTLNLCMELEICLYACVVEDPIPAMKSFIPERATCIVLCSDCWFMYSCCVMVSTASVPAIVEGIPCLEQFRLLWCSSCGLLAGMTVVASASSMLALEFPCCACSSGATVSDLVVVI